MKILKNSAGFCGAMLAIFLLAGCEDVIDLQTETGPSLLVVDSWITNEPGPQKVRLTKSAGYFDNSPAPVALNATVQVEDNLGNVYQFADSEAKGEYLWTPPRPDSVMGAIGRTYKLTVTYDGEIFTAQSEIKRVPAVDSLVFTAESLPVKPEKGPQDGFIAEFYGKDLEGVGDCYWIRPLKDGKLYKNRPANITIAYDASFGSEINTDGLVFIQPLRRALTIDELFVDGDKVGVELYSINEEAFRFLERVRTESSNGGLFAVPSANLPTNLKNANGKKALGFFGASAVSRLEQKVDAKTARPRK